jgi:hypothetical protein
MRCAPFALVLLAACNAPKPPAEVEPLVIDSVTWQMRTEAGLAYVCATVYLGGYDAILACSDFAPESRTGMKPVGGKEM